MKNIVIILSAGKSTRFNRGKHGKVLYRLNRETVLENTMNIFERDSKIDNIVLVLHKNNFYINKRIKKKYSKILSIIEGGDTRDNSIIKGIKELDINQSINIIIHDGCRPLLSQSVIKTGLLKLADYDMVKTVGIPDDDIVLNSDTFKTKFKKRDDFYLASSPDFVKSSLFNKIDLDTLSLNDCVSNRKMVNLGFIISNPENIKITYEKDINIAKNIYRNMKKTIKNIL